MFFFTFQRVYQIHVSCRKPQYVCLHTLNFFFHNSILVTVVNAAQITTMRMVVVQVRRELDDYSFIIITNILCEPNYKCLLLAKLLKFKNAMNHLQNVMKLCKNIDFFFNFFSFLRVPGRNVR